MPKSPSPAREASVESPSQSSDVSPKHHLVKDTLLFDSDVAVLEKAISSVSNEAARTATRRNWRKCLIGSEREQSFFVRAILKHSTPHVFARVMNEHSEKMLEVASAEFLDRAMEMRFKTIDAKELVALLAKAKRLGYDEEDLVDDDEDVIPAEAEVLEDSSGVEEIQGPKLRDNIMTGQSDSLLEEQNRNAAAAAAALQASSQTFLQSVDLPNRDKINRWHVCPDCNASFAQSAGLTYHVERRVCHKPSPVYKCFCTSCGKGFTTAGGKLYHERNRVCAGHETAKATSPGSQFQHKSESTPPPHLPGGVKRLSYSTAPPPSQIPPATATTYQQAPFDITPASSIPPSAKGPINNGGINTASPKLPQRTGQQGHEVYEVYPDFRIGVPFQSLVPPGSTTEESPEGTRVLDAATQAEMNKKIAAEVERFEQKCREIPDTLTAAEREEEINKQKRGHATRKSQIRKKYGIQVRSSKLRPANALGTSDDTDLVINGTPEAAPLSDPISRIGSFRAPLADMTPTSVASTPTFGGQGRRRPTEEPGPDSKRRRVGDPPFAQPAQVSSFVAVNTPNKNSDNNLSNSGSQADPYGVPGGLQRRMPKSAVSQGQQRKELEVEKLNSSESSDTMLQPSVKPKAKKVPISAAQRQWELLQPQKSAAYQALSSTPGNKPPNVTGDPVVITLSESDSRSGSDSDLNEDIPAKKPVQSVRRTTSLSISPVRITTSNTSPGKGLAKRRGSGILSATLPKNRSKLRATVQV